MDDGLKQRLIGAIVLIAIAVLFVPSLFEKNSQRTVDLSTQIPDEPEFVTEILELPEPVRPQNIPPASEIKPLADNDPSSANQALDLPLGDNQDQAQTIVEPNNLGDELTRENAVSTTSVLDSDGVPVSWSIQVASFTSKERAQALIDKLQADGHKSYQREASSAQGLLYRVYVGPKLDKQLILDAKAQIDKKYNTSAIVLEFKS